MVHLGPHFRTFVELVNGVTAGTTKKKSSFEQDSLDEGPLSNVTTVSFYIPKGFTLRIFTVL
jgi:hypothetical protein